jgi:hypothetical protein
MQISEYDITNEIGERSYCLHDLIFYIILHTSSIVIDRYSKEFARVLGTGQIVTSLKHLAQCRGVQVNVYLSK